MRWKILSIVAGSLCFAFGALSCSSGSLKVYSVDPDQAALVRKHKNEVLPFVKAKGYLCMSPPDYEQMLQACHGGHRVAAIVEPDPSRKREVILMVVTAADGVKVYYLEPTQGLIRKQAGEVLTFLQARGYLCMSPSDFEEVLQSCS